MQEKGVSVSYMEYFWISFVLQITVLPLPLSKSAANLDILGTSVCMLITGIFVVISSLSVGSSSILELFSLTFCFFGTLNEVDTMRFGNIKKARLHILLWILIGIIIVNVIAFFV